MKFATRSTTSSGERRQTGIPIDPVLFIVTFNGVAIITANGPFYSPGIADRACRPGLVRFVEPDGSKMAAAINQDGTINSQTHPAPAGSVVTLWATGLGQTNPPGVDGQMQTNIAAKYLADVQVTIGGAPTAEQYAGPAPSFARLSQINLQIPQTKSGAQPVQCSSARRRFRRTCSYGFSRGASAPFPCSFRSTLSLNPKMCIDVDRREESG